MKHNVRRNIVDFLFYLVGTALYAVSVNIFMAPKNFVSGGVTGIGLFLHHLFNFPIGVSMVLFNLPLLILAFYKFGFSFTIRTTVASVLVSILIDVTAPFLPAFESEDKMLSAVFAGILSGIGLGLIYMRGATTGGSELLAKLLEKKLAHIPAGRIILVVDIVVVAVSILVFKNFESALYSVVLIFISSSLMDAIIYGKDKGKMILVVSNHDKEIARQLLQSLDRGVTILKAKGAYTGEDKEVLLCAVRPAEFYEVKLIVYSVDPSAFMIITTADDVLGHGFKVEKLHHNKKKKSE